MTNGRAIYGSICDGKKILLIGSLEAGDVVMAEGGFDIQHVLAEKKIILNIPPFMKGKTQSFLEKEFEIRSIASVRILERAIRCAVKPSCETYCG